MWWLGRENLSWHLDGHIARSFFQLVLLPCPAILRSFCGLGKVVQAGSGLEALGSRAGLATVTEMDNLKTRSAAGGEKKNLSFLSVKNCPERNVAKSGGKTAPGDWFCQGR